MGERERGREGERERGREGERERDRAGGRRGGEGVTNLLQERELQARLDMWVAPTNQV